MTAKTKSDGSVYDDDLNAKWIVLIISEESLDEDGKRRASDVYWEVANYRLFNRSEAERYVKRIEELPDARRAILVKFDPIQFFRGFS